MEIQTIEETAKIAALRKVQFYLYLNQVENQQDLDKLFGVLKIQVLQLTLQLEMVKITLQITFPTSYTIK